MNHEQQPVTIPEIIADHRVARSAEEATYLALVRLCHDRKQWYPEVTHQQITTWEPGQRIQYPTETHPVLEDTRYHRYGQVDQPLNKRGRRKLAWMQHRYDRLDQDYWEINGCGILPL